jgi:hypothetical protein
MNDDEIRTQLKQLVCTAKRKLSLPDTTPSSEITVIWSLDSSFGSKENLRPLITGYLYSGYTEVIQPWGPSRSTSASLTKDEIKALILDGAWQKKPPHRVP